MTAYGKPYIYMFFIAPIAGLFTLIISNDGILGYLVITSLAYSLIGLIFGYHRPSNAWQWGILASIPIWILHLPVLLEGTIIDRVKGQPFELVLSFTYPCIAASVGAYIGVGIKK